MAYCMYLQSHREGKYYSTMVNNQLIIATDDLGLPPHSYTSASTITYSHK